MNIDNLTIGDAKQIAAMIGGVQKAQEPLGDLGRKVIVRSRDEYAEVAQ